MNIGQAAKASGVNAKLIRYYESIGLIPEAGRTASGYRVYTKQEVNILRFVKRVALDHVAELEAKIAEMQAMADTLRELADACHGDHRPDCPILHDLENQSTTTGRDQVPAH